MNYIIIILYVTLASKHFHLVKNIIRSNSTYIGFSINNALITVCTYKLYTTLTLFLIELF